MSDLLACPECGEQPRGCTDDRSGETLYMYRCCGHVGFECDSLCDAQAMWNYHPHVIDCEIKRLRATIDFQASQILTANKALRVFKRMTEKGYLKQ